MNGDVYFFHYTFVDVSYYLLDHLKLLEEFTSCFQNILRENILFSIYPKVWEALLGGVQDLRQVAKTTLLVKNFICFRKLFSVLSGGAHCFESLTEPFDLIEKSFASSLSIFGIKIIFLIRALLEVIAHHHGVFQEEEVA